MEERVGCEKDTFHSAFVCFQLPRGAVLVFNSIFMRILGGSQTFLSQIKFIRDHSSHANLRVDLLHVPVRPVRFLFLSCSGGRSLETSAKSFPSIFPFGLM